MSIATTMENCAQVVLEATGADVLTLCAFQLRGKGGGMGRAMGVYLVKGVDMTDDLRAKIVMELRDLATAIERKEATAPTRSAGR